MPPLAVTVRSGLLGGLAVVLYGLRSGPEASRATSAIHLDILSGLQQVVSHAAAVAEAPAPVQPRTTQTVPEPWTVLPNRPEPSSIVAPGSR